MKTCRIYAVMLFILLFPISSLAGSCPFGTMEKGWCWPTEKGGWGNLLDWHGVNPAYPGIHLGKDIAPGDNAIAGPNKSGRRAVSLADGVVYAVKDDVCGYGGITTISDGTTCKYKRGAGMVIRHTTTSGQDAYILYAHLDPLTARWHVGDTVMQGQDIGILNDYTGGSIHLHLGVSLTASSNPWPGYGDTDGIFINPVTFLQSNNPRPGFVIRSAPLSNGKVYWRTKNLTDLSCENAQAWLVEDNDKAMSYETNSSICPKSCNSSSAMNDSLKWLDFFIKPTYAGLSDCATTVSSMPSGGSSTSESSNPKPITGGTNSGTLADLIPNNSDIENASKTKVTTLHINESGFCKMQTKNIGNKDAGSFQSQCWISDGYKIDKYPKDEGKEDTSSLAKGATHTEHEDFIAPEFPGTYNAVWCTDSAGPSPGQIKELKEGNNCHDEDPFTVWSNPNVLATSVTMSGGKVVLVPGESYFADTTITNNGENFGKGIVVGWYLTGPGTGGVRVLIDTDNIQRENLRGGVSKVESLSTRFASETGGIYTLEACPDYDNRIAETNEGDNCKSVNFEVYIAPPPSPENLVGVSVDFGNEQVTEINETFTPGFTVRNDGIVGTNLIKIGYYLDNNLVGTDQIQPGNLPTGDTKRETLEGFSVPTVGQHTFKACVDYLGEITESNEGDNCSSLTFNAQLPSGLVGVAIDFNNEQVIEVNETFTPGFTVRNDGVVGNTLIKIGYYLDGTLTGTDQIQASNLLPGGTKRETLESFSVPTEGTHTLKACVDYLNEIAEANEGDNCVEKTFTAVVIVYKPSNSSSITTCPIPSDPDFNVMPTIPSGDVGATLFGNNRQKLFLPVSALAQAKTGLVWGGFADFDPSLVTKICWGSDVTYWGVTSSTACTTGFVLEGNNWVADIPNTPQASKGTWSFKQGTAEYWIKPDSITNLILDTDGHIRYNNWTPNTVTVSDDVSGMTLNASFGTKSVSGFWLPAGGVLNGKIFWNNDQDNYPGMPGVLECDANGKLKATIANVAPASTGRIILGLTTVDSYGWQTTNQWILPTGATIVNADGDYKLPTSASLFQKREVTYDKGQQKLTITISGDSRMLDSFFGITKIDQVTTESWFSAWIVPEGQVSKLIKGTVTRSTTGIWTLVFTGLPPDFGGSVYLKLSNGMEGWQDVSKFAFGSGIVADVTAGNYRMPK